MNILVLNFILVFLFHLIINYELCPRYNCDNELGKDICGRIKLTQNHDTKEFFKDYRLFPCSNHKDKCQISMLSQNLDAKCIQDTNSSHIIVEEKVKKLPGNKCINHNECYSENCKNSKCSGNSIGELCESHADCDVELFCDSQKICIPQLLEGAICRNDFDCHNTMGCNNKICTKYYSLPIEKDSEDDRFCETGYIKNNKCIKGPRIKNKKLPYRCFRNTTYVEKCEYIENDGNTFKLDCECGINKDGASFCPLGKGDSEYFTFIETIKRIYIHKCHTLIRNDEKRCDEIDKADLKKFVQTSWIFNRHHLLQNNEFCVKETILYEFYHLSSSKIPVINVISFIILIVLIL